MSDEIEQRYFCGRRLAEGEASHNPINETLAGLCAWEVTDLVSDHPRDGVEFTIPCPACGHPLGFRRDPERVPEVA